ncbi:hypothetical protein [Streptomyces sp. NPDC095602]|uniref:hypothetical protein n=1 Tax=unclassified Streptomyces TaxID=2593676 RepID=UPI00332B096C
MTPEPPTRTEPEAADTARVLRAALSEAAYATTPPPIPLAAIERAGRARRRRRATALATGCVLAVTTVTLTLTQLMSRPAAPDAATPPSPVHTPTTAPRPSASAVSNPVGAPRIVEPGERVDAGGGWTVWLTAAGKHWKGPDGYENVRSVTDGNIDLAAPGISHQSEGDAKRTFHSGLYYGTKTAARLDITDDKGTRTTATLLELPGRPGWGVWYATTPPGGGSGSERLSLYDGAGALITSYPPG